MFLLKSYYGTIDELLVSIKAGGVTEVHFFNTSQMEFIPKSLTLPFMLGAAGIIYGVK